MNVKLTVSERHLLHNLTLGVPYAEYNLTSVELRCMRKLLNYGYCKRETIDHRVTIVVTDAGLEADATA